jgi:RNA polymerase primary sigma factor
MGVATKQRAGLTWYLDRIKDTPLLTAEQERQLSRRIREHSDTLAREQMIAANLRLVIKVAKQYTNPCMTLSDLVAEGNIGLMRAVEEFNPDAGVRFSTYAAWWIRQAIMRALINAGQPIHIPAYLSKLIRKWRRTSSLLESDLGRPPTVEEMAAKLKISRKKADIVQQGLLAVNSPSQMGGEGTSAAAETIADPQISLPEQTLLDASNGQLVETLMKKLDPRERKILELRFGMDGYDGPPRTFKEIGVIIGLTRERVRQLEKQALISLREAARETL